MWWNRNASSADQGRACRRGSAPCGRASAERAAPRTDARAPARGRPPRPTRTPCRSTDGGARTACSSGPRRSSRAARSAWIDSARPPAESPSSASRPFAAPEQSVVLEHPEHLLDEQRVALGRVDDPREDRGVQAGRRADRDQPSLSRCESARAASSSASVSLDAHPGRTSRSLGPPEAEQDDRRVRVQPATYSTRSRNVGSAQWHVVEHRPRRTLAREHTRGADGPPRTSPHRRRSSRTPRRRRARPRRVGVLRTGERLPIFVLADVARLAAAIPQASFTSSTTGQNVIPSPYARHRPRHAGSSPIPAELLDGRDFPTPAATEDGDASTHARAPAGGRTPVELIEAPARAADEARGRRPVGRGGTGFDAEPEPRHRLGLALQRERPSGSSTVTSLADEARRWRRPRRISPGPAAGLEPGRDVHRIAHDQRPAALRRRPRPRRCSPRSASRASRPRRARARRSARPGARASRRPRARHGARRPRGARAPRRPPSRRRRCTSRRTAVALEHARIAPKNAVITRRTDSGSSRSPSGVEPTTSQKTTVRVLRASPDEGARGCGNGSAHAMQNRARAGFISPQTVQAGIDPESRSALLALRRRTTRS